MLLHDLQKSYCATHIILIVEKRLAHWNSHSFEPCEVNDRVNRRVLVKDLIESRPVTQIALLEKEIHLVLSLSDLADSIQNFCAWVF